MRTIIRVFVCAILGGLLWVGTAHAHSRYLRSEPGAGAIVATPPSRVDIWFSQELFRRKGENTITVTGPDGQVVSAGDTGIDDDDRTHIWVNLQPGLTAGDYLVEWRNVSLEDGHPSDDSFRFTIDPQAVLTSTPMGTALPSATESDTINIPSPQPATPRPVVPCPGSIVLAIGLFGFATIKTFYRK